MRTLSNLILSFLLLAVVGCSDDPTSALQEADAEFAAPDAELVAAAKGNNENREVINVVDVTAFNPCTGEELLVNGTTRRFFNFRFSGGGVHITVHSNFHGTAIGLTTGAEYVWNRAVNETFNSDVEDIRTNINFVSLRNVVAIGNAADNWLLRERFSLTVNAQGELVMLNEVFDFVCK